MAMARTRRGSDRVGDARGRVRPSQDDVLMATARAWAQRSTCSRLSVGAVVSREGRIIATGYNGAPPGLPHCPDPHPQPCTQAVHAEANALAFAARHGVATRGAELHVTHAPCRTCAMLLLSAGIVCVTFGETYRSTDGLMLLGRAEIPVYGPGAL